MMVEFRDQPRAEYGVEPICEELPIALEGQPPPPESGELVSGIPGVIQSRMPGISAGLGQM
ncbi:MAG: hypothetical protein KIT57_14070 [Blastocatellales bacterium]|nr:hypothetical protein [Blastocatellales bacterium]